MDHALIGVLATIAAARGDTATAKARVMEVVERARAIGDPQVMHQAMGRAARLVLEAGEADTAGEYLTESLAALRDSISKLAPETTEAAIVAQALGRGSQLLDVMTGAMGQTPWADASAAILEERFEDAGDTLEGHGDLAHAALVRLVGAERGGHRTPELAKAIAFATRVQASGWLARADAIGSGAG